MRQKDQIHKEKAHAKKQKQLHDFANGKKEEKREKVAMNLKALRMEQKHRADEIMKKIPVLDAKVDNLLSDRKNTAVQRGDNRLQKYQEHYESL